MSSSPTPSSNSTKSSSSSSDDNAPTMLQYCFAGIILGAAAGLTFYTKKTGQMLKQMERMNANAAQRKPKPKPGPMTKEQHEKTRNRWENDDI